MKIRIFTDGACSGNPGPGGWAIVINKKEKCRVKSGGQKNTTNNRMELLAVVQALKEILQWLEKTWDRKESAEAEVYSDSAYVINAITKGWLAKWKMNGWKTTAQKDVKNKDLWEQFFRLLVEIKLKWALDVKFVKVKGHSGNTFNEQADRFARKEVQKLKENI